MTLKRSGWKIALSIAIGLGILIGVLSFVGWRETFAQMVGLGLLGILSVLGNVLMSMTFWILCWWVILRSYGIQIPFRSIIGARFAGYAVSYLTPTLYFGGEPVRAMLVLGKSEAPTTRIVATIVVERFLGGLSMIVFILMGSFYALSSQQIPAPERRLLAFAIGFVTFWILVGLINFAGNFKWISRSIRLLGRLVQRWRKALDRAAAKVSETEDEVYNAFTKHWKGTLVAFLLQTVATFFVYTRPQFFFWFSSGTLSGTLFTFPQLSLIFAFTIMLSFFLWITPGGLGTAEAALVAVFALVIPAATSAGVVAYSLTFKLAESIFVAMGMIYLTKRGIQYMRTRAVEKPPELNDK
ncbi:flippase-like domain-containing protein [Candidatus Bipolaricaulota bacterium]|nr:flippase-like domain-containing protein [Candidatus Bipolaricaulota bacterium]